MTQHKKYPTRLSFSMRPMRLLGLRARLLLAGGDGVSSPQGVVEGVPQRYFDVQPQQGIQERLVTLD